MQRARSIRACCTFEQREDDRLFLGDVCRQERVEAVELAREPPAIIRVDTTLAVKGPAVLTNLDEATLDIVGGKSGMHVAKIGKPVTLARGTYKIVMVGQASDDNVLTLVVR